MKKLIILLLLSSLFLCSCGDFLDPPTIKVDPRIVVVNKNAEEVEEAVKTIKDNMVYFEKDKKCFAVVFTRSFGKLGIASFTEVSSCPK